MNLDRDDLEALVEFFELLAEIEKESNENV